MSFLAGIELATNQDGRLELVAIAHEDAADVVWHRWERLEGGWSEWHSFGKPGGPLSGQPVAHRPTAARNMNGCLEVVVVGVDQGVYRAWQDHPGRAWRGWHALNKPGESEAVTRVRCWGRATTADWSCSLWMATGKCGTAGRTRWDAGCDGTPSGRPASGPKHPLPRSRGLRTAGWNCSYRLFTGSYGTAGSSVKEAGAPGSRWAARTAESGK